MIYLNGVKVEPTRFPDGTTQAWKLPDIPWATLDPNGQIVIDWRFEREDEFFTVAQLRALFSKYPCALRVPYFPYARQDKEISNDATFALHPFGNLLNNLKFEKVVAWDVHNPRLTHKLIANFSNVLPVGMTGFVVGQTKAKTVIFPDQGAQLRYDWLDRAHDLAKVVYAKKRDQATGKIMGLERAEGEFAPGPCLIVDDICDGGATFLGVHEAMKAEGVRDQHELHLFVTHGIFSKGKKVLEDAGIRLWTTNSLPRNADAIPLEDGLPYQIERKG